MNNGNCVAVAANWRKSTRSASDECVETADGTGMVLVRDTADRGGVTLEFPPGAWSAFTGRLMGAVLGRGEGRRA
jgi:hypothetical protein